MTTEKEATSALKRGDVPAAISAARALILSNPEEPIGYFVLGMAAAEAGHVAKAIPLVEEAVRRGPEAEHLAQLARLRILMRQDGAAGEAARAALALRPQDGLTLDTIGCVLARLGDHAGSIAPFTMAVAADPDNLGFRYNLAAAKGFVGKVEEAERHYEAVLARAPGDARVHYALAILSRQTAEKNHIARLETALKNARTPAETLRIHYALAKEFEDIGDAPGAFHHLSTANKAHKESLKYDFAQDAAIFDSIEQLFGTSNEQPATRDGYAGAAPIFVIGMPRTGTTLVDRILSSHPDVESAGELQAMPLAVKQLAGTQSRLIIDPSTVAASGSADAAQIGETYMARAAKHRMTNKPRFTDKLPANFLYVGHIARSLPDARIVCLRRNPLDTIWSNYKNLFASQSAYYAYSYDLMDTARYYQRFDRLMALWERLWPGRVLQLSYEGLVAQQEQETGRLLEHCGLTWDDACLTFHNNKAAVATPSAAQVRRPLNADAIGKWRAHADALAPARTWLEAQAIMVE